MAYIHSEAVSLAPTTSGTSVTYLTSNTYNGYLEAVQYTPTTSAIPSTGGAIAITGERSGRTLFSIADLSTANTGLYHVRFGTVNSTMGTSTGAARHPLFDERLQIVVTSGSTDGTRTASVRFYVE